MERNKIYPPYFHNFFVNGGSDYVAVTRNRAAPSKPKAVCSNEETTKYIFMKVFLRCGKSNVFAV